MRHGLVIGKFYPPHVGHHHLIDVAARQVDRLTVLVMASRAESLTLDERVRWLAEVHRDAPVDVIGAPCDVPMDLESDVVWTAHVAIMRGAVHAHTSAPIDVVFSSESYGPELAYRLGAEHVSVDPARVERPVSGTAVRHDLAGCWDHLHPVVRGGLATRVVVLGAESTGTTTGSSALADAYRARGGVWARTGWVPEYGREHTVLKQEQACEDADRRGLVRPPMEELVWDAKDFAQVAERQSRLEEQAARDGSPSLVCDTDALATRVWERRYVGRDSHAAAGAVPTLSARRIYLLTDHVGVPFVQDGWRDGEHIRADMTEWFVEELTAAGVSWALLSGSLEERIDLARRVINEALLDAVQFDEPLGTGLAGRAPLTAWSPADALAGCGAGCI
ncbi:AAA family ATPase [Nocardioides panacis]|uniref:AAA family ATPase n=1 Tax=Nocardioides panacis TaxID=2849501 RepID=A0A975T2G4_9ACTN|nr:AAA family ATPase [Nocardioides panacis]QWZ10453.1 AAA family ATPase [Nocardioides panacis]